MTVAIDEWPFLPDAWRYALVLTADEESATLLVRDALNALSHRTDAADPHRAQRILFSLIFRAGRNRPTSNSPKTPAEEKAMAFHRLPEPGRSAWSLLCLGLFSGEHLAGLLGQSEAELAAALGEARSRYVSEPAS